MLSYEGDTEYITRLENESEVVINKILPREKVIGFGCQWKGGTDSKVGTIQIATPCMVYIFHIGAYKQRMENEESSSSENEDEDLLIMTPQNQIRKNRKKMFAKEMQRKCLFDLDADVIENDNEHSHFLMSHHLRYLLESSNYLKVGVNINADFMKLSEDFDLQSDPNSILELGQFYNDKVGADYTQCWNLSTLCYKVFEAGIERKDEITKSEWTQYPLNDEQLKYCSETAHFSLKLFFAIMQIAERQKMDFDDSDNESDDDLHSFFDGDDDDEYDADFDEKISCGKLEKLQQRFYSDQNITDLAIQNVDFTQMNKTKQNNHHRFKRIDVQQNLLAKIRKYEVMHYKSMDCVLSKYWMWSWHNFIFPNCKALNGKYTVYGTGNMDKRSLSMKKKEVYASLTLFDLDFEQIINFRGYPLKINQIEMYLADIINFGYLYNWKKINDAILKRSNYFKQQCQNDDEIALNEDSFFVDFVFLQIKVIELLQKQINEILQKYAKTKEKLLHFYDLFDLNPYKLQKRAKNKKNDENENENDLIPKNYEKNLDKIKEIFDEIWMFIKLKPLRNEIIHYFLNQSDDSFKIDLSLIRYSLIRMIVFHCKRVVWSKHFIVQ